MLLINSHLNRFVIHERKKSIPAGKFKAKCLALLDEVNQTGEEIIVTKYRKPVTKIAPLGNTLEEVRKKITTKIVGDIVSPLDPEDWGRLG